MTEAEWLAATDPQQMLRFLRGTGVSDRRLRLFACACCREVWDLIEALEQARIGAGCAAVVLAERLADGQAEPGAVALAVEDFVGLIDSGSSPESQLLQGALPALAREPMRAAADAALYSTRARYDAVLRRAMRERDERRPGSRKSVSEAVSALTTAMARQATLLRDIVPNPFRTPGFPASWRSATAVALARTMYESRDFSLMPILADALMDAGCDDEAVLAHCRGNGPHVRGCHVVDLVLGKD